MRTTNRSVGVLAGCLLLVSVGVLFAQDWPQWRGTNRDGKVTGFTVPGTWPKSLVEKWKKSVGLGDATPALVGDKLYVFTRRGDDEVPAVSQRRGRKRALGEQVPGQSGHRALGAGPRWTEKLTCRSGRQRRDSGCDRGCVLRGCGQRQDSLAKRRLQEGAPVLYFHVADRRRRHGRGATGRIRQRNDGRLRPGLRHAKWTWKGDGPSYASPVLMTVDGVKQIVTLTDKNVVGLAAADGKVLWEIPFAPGGRMSYNAATPIVEGDTVIFTGQGRGTKAVKVEKDGDKFVTKPIWSNDQLAPQFNSPVLKDGLLFGLTDRGLFYCIDAKTGKTAWTDKTSHGRGFCALVDAGPVLLALPASHELIAFKADGKGYSELAKYQVSSKQTYASPVVAGQRIFVKDADAVTLWMLE